MDPHSACPTGRCSQAAHLMLSRGSGLDLRPPLHLCLVCLFVDLDCLLAVGPGGGGGGGGRGPSRCCILGPWWGLPNVVYSLLSLFSCFRDQPAVPPRWELTTLMAAKIKLLFSLVTSDVAIHLQGVPFLEQVEAS